MREREQDLEGNSEEWLRRIAVDRSLEHVPDTVAFTLIAVGFAQKTTDGAFAATEAGKQYLTDRGIQTRKRFPTRR